MSALVFVLVRDGTLLVQEDILLKSKKYCDFKTNNTTKFEEFYINQTMNKVNRLIDYLSGYDNHVDQILIKLMTDLEISNDKKMCVKSESKSYEYEKNVADKLLDLLISKDFYMPNKMYSFNYTKIFDSPRGLLFSEGIFSNYQNYDSKIMAFSKYEDLPQGFCANLDKLNKFYFNNAYVITENIVKEFGTELVTRMNKRITLQLIGKGYDAIMQIKKLDFDHNIIHFELKYDIILSKEKLVK